MNTDLKYNKLTENIIKTFYKIYNKLGYGFLEKVYDNNKNDYPCKSASIRVPLK